MDRSSLDKWRGKLLSEKVADALAHATLVPQLFVLLPTSIVLRMVARVTLAGGLANFFGELSKGK